MARRPFKMPVIRLVGTSSWRANPRHHAEFLEFFGQVLAGMYRDYCHSAVLMIVDNFYP